MYFLTIHNFKISSNKKNLNKYGYKYYKHLIYIFKNFRNPCCGGRFIESFTSEREKKDFFFNYVILKSLIIIKKINLFNQQLHL